MAANFEGRRPTRRRARRWENALLDTTSDRVDRDRIWVRQSSIGYICIGLGPTASIARFAFKDESEDHPFFEACRRLDRDLDREGRAKAERLGITIPLDGIDDPALRRLAVADALIKAGFHPDEPRDPHGEWDSSGGAAAATAATASASALAETAPGAEFPWKIWSEALLRLLPRAASLTNIFALAGGLILIPANRSGGLESGGTLPGNPDIAFQRSEGRLTLYRVDENGVRALIYDGYPGGDQFYRDDQGNIVARDLGIDVGFVADPAAVSALSVRASRRRRDGQADEEDNAIAPVRAVSVAKDEPQLCPDPSKDRRGNENSINAIAYQAQITGLPQGYGVLLNGVMFDGCRKTNGNMLEAKDFYSWAMVNPNADYPMSPDIWQVWYDGREESEDQMRDQSVAAGPRIAEWHFSQKPVADYFRWYAAQNHLDNIRVYWTPAVVTKEHRVSYSEMLLSKSVVAIERPPWLGTTHSHHAHGNANRVGHPRPETGRRTNEF